MTEPIRSPETREERLLAIMHLYGVDIIEAESILAIEDGETDGDIVIGGDEDEGEDEEP